MTEKLKPCPFCGGEEISVGSFGAASGTFLHYVKCEECDGASTNHQFEDEAIAAWNRRALSASIADTAKPFQERVHPWMLECFGAEIAADRIERNHRFFEEATELVQANGMTRSEAHQLVDYTFDRPVGELHQEIGGVMVTLAALCLASDANMHDAGETELARIWTKIEKIRAKQAAKPKHSPLPQEVIADTAGAKPVAIDCGECACLPGFCDKEGRIRNILRMIVDKINAEGPAAKDWRGFNQLCELAELELSYAAPPAPSVADAAGASDTERLDFVIENNAFLVWCERDGSIVQCQLYKGDDDENVWPICGDDKYFNSPREAIDAAIAKESK